MRVRKEYLASSECVLELRTSSLFYRANSVMSANSFLVTKFSTDKADALIEFFRLLLSLFPVRLTYTELKCCKQAFVLLTAEIYRR